MNFQNILQNKFVLQKENFNIPEKTIYNLQARREKTHRLAELQSEVAGKTEEMKISEGREAALKEDAESLRSRIEELTERLKSAREAELKIEETYR